MATTMSSVDLDLLMGYLGLTLRIPDFLTFITNMLAGIGSSIGAEMKIHDLAQRQQISSDLEYTEVKITNLRKFPRMVCEFER